MWKRKTDPAPWFPQTPRHPTRFGPTRTSPQLHHTLSINTWPVATVYMRATARQRELHLTGVSIGGDYLPTWLSLFSTMCGPRPPPCFPRSVFIIFSFIFIFIFYFWHASVTLSLCSSSPKHPIQSPRPFVSGNRPYACDLIKHLPCNFCDSWPYPKLLGLE